ncbi:MAG: hypothetical protein M0Q38_13695 [Bacteroidales bacterium]|jgi:hypothetical protein|nr:hypothetical protein [Bacteroidales bacterium]
MSLVKKLKPSVSKHNLLFIAGLAWTTAGGILMWRGLDYEIRHSTHLVLNILAGIIIGVPFYIVLFAKISGKHIKRIWGMNIPYPCAFSFFNLRSYIMMMLMITTGILLRRFDVINREYLFTFYIAMALPLLISASRFYYSWATKKEIE